MKHAIASVVLPHPTLHAPLNCLSLIGDSPPTEILVAATLAAVTSNIVLVLAVVIGVTPALVQGLVTIHLFPMVIADSLSPVRHRSLYIKFPWLEGFPVQMALAAVPSVAAAETLVLKAPGRIHGLTTLLVASAGTRSTVMVATTADSVETVFAHLKAAASVVLVVNPLALTFLPHHFCHETIPAMLLTSHEEPLLVLALLATTTFFSIPLAVLLSRSPSGGR